MSAKPEDGSREVAEWRALALRRRALFKDDICMRSVVAIHGNRARTAAVRRRGQGGELVSGSREAYWLRALRSWMAGTGTRAALREELSGSPTEQRQASYARMLAAKKRRK